MRIIRLKHSVQSEEYDRYAICKMMGWDYYTFDRQPLIFLQHIRIFIAQENETGRSPGGAAQGEDVNIDVDVEDPEEKPKGISR